MTLPTPLEQKVTKPRGGREITVGETEKWLEKLSKLTSHGAKMVHVKNLLIGVMESDRKHLIKKVEGMRKPDKEYPNYCSCDGECFGDCERSRDVGYNQAQEDVKQLLETL